LQIRSEWGKIEGMMSTGHHSPTAEEAAQFGREMRKFVDELLASGKAKEWMVKRGFLTKSGKLPKRYR
jgi:hypothetical protein